MSILSYAEPDVGHRSRFGWWLVPIGLLGSILPALAAYFLAKNVFGFNGCPHCEAPTVASSLLFGPPAIGTVGAIAVVVASLRFRRYWLAAGSVVITLWTVANFVASLGFWALLRM
ncbi:MAG: hypothetical protein AAGD32_03740 [Planctomycetota bacterium]